MTPEEAVKTIKLAGIIECTKEQFPEIKAALQKYAAQQIDFGQDIYAIIALNEIKRLGDLFKT